MKQQEDMLQCILNDAKQKCSVALSISCKSQHLPGYRNRYSDHEYLNPILVLGYLVESRI